MPTRIIFVFLSLLITLALQAQKIQRPNDKMLGIGYQYISGDKGVLVGTYAGKPPMPDSNILNERKAISVFDTLNHKKWTYDPSLNDWIQDADGRPTPLQQAIDLNPALNKSNVISASGFSFGISADTFAIVGNGTNSGVSSSGSNTIVTKFGVVNSDASLSGQVAVSTGLPVIRSSYQVGVGSFPFETVAGSYRNKEVHVVVNMMPADGSRTYPDSATIDNYTAQLASIIDVHFAPYNIYYIAVQNEPFNGSYYQLDAGAARRYAYFLKKVSGLFKSKDARYYISDGGVSGPAMDYFVLKYLDSTGQTAAYNAYKAARFTPTQQATVDNWSTSGTYINDIARYKEYFSYLKNMDSVDAISLHYPLPINNDDDFDTSLLCSAIEAYSFLSGGKDIVFNEVDFRNQSTTIPPKVVAKFNSLGVKYVVFYNGTDNSYTGNNNAFVSADGTSLLSNGSSLRTKFNALSGIVVNTNANVMEVYKDGTIRFPGLANAGSLRTDATGKIIQGAAPIGGSGGGTYLSQSVNTNGQSTTIVMYVGSIYTVTNVTNTTENGGGITGFVQNGDSVYVSYSIAPYGAVNYKISVVNASGTMNTNQNSTPMAILTTDRFTDDKRRYNA
jgi:hypothetical protein